MLSSEIYRYVAVILQFLCYQYSFLSLFNALSFFYDCYAILFYKLFAQSMKMVNSELAPQELSKLKDLDELLKCGICYENLKNTLMTPCSHNFCSYCIRKSLLYRNQCPACFENTNESQLRSNRVVDEFITIYSTVREKLLKYLVRLPIIKYTADNQEVNEEFLIGKKKGDIICDEAAKRPVTSSSSSELLSQCSPIKNEPSTSKKEILIPSMFSPKKTKSSNVIEVKVSCPVCSVEIPEKNINIHLDACLKRSHEKRKTCNEKRKHLPKLVYNLLQEKELRKKLNDIGLSTIGDRKTLINRHKRYTLLYNSECDSLSPKSIPEIIKQVKKEEEEEKKASAQVVKKLNVDRKADPKVNEEAQRQYMEEHKSSFQKLIEEARRNKNTRKNSNDKQGSEPALIDLGENSSETSEIEFEIKRTHKRKLISSDSETDEEGEMNEEFVENVSEVVTQANIHHHKSTSRVTENICSQKKKSNKENEEILMSDSKPSNLKTLLESPNNYDLIDEIIPTESDEDAVKNTNKKVNTRLKNSDNDRALQPSISSNSPPLVTSPVVSTKFRHARTPTSACRYSETTKRDLTPDLLQAKTTVAGASHSQDLAEDVDSDSSSNQSTSLLVYTGPDCEFDLGQSTPTKTPIKCTPPPVTSPVSEQRSFDLGIQGILQNSEDFVPLPVRRRSRRIKTSQKNTPEGDLSSRGLRKRIRIDDL